MSELRPVPGPSALGGGWRRSFELLKLIAISDFKRVYLGTVLGSLWSICRPLLLFGVLLVVFSSAFRLGDSVEHYPVLLLLNIVLFGFFQEATSAAVGSIVGQESIVRKTQFPRAVIPLATVLTSAFNLSLNLIVVVVFLLCSGVAVQATWLLFPVLLLALGVFTTAVAMLLSSLYPRYRDVAIIWSVAATALIYATPVLFPLDYVSVSLRHVLGLNPLAPIFELTHKWIVDSSAPSPMELTGGGVRLLIPLGLYVLVCVLGVWSFAREAPRVAEAL